MTQLNGLITNIRSILHLLASQMTALKQLRDIIKKGYYAHYTPSHGYHDNHLHLPFRLQGFRTLRVVLRELDILIAERKEHTKEFQKLIRSLEQRQTTYTIFHAMNTSTYRVADTLKTNILEAIETNKLYRNESTVGVLKAFDWNNSHRNTMTDKVLAAARENLSSRESATEEIVKSMDKETESVVEQRDIALMTSQTMSMFTVVTVFFLPLGFFCSVEPPHHSFDWVR
jgi:Fe2+ transport system protein B